MTSESLFMRKLLAICVAGGLVWALRFLYVTPGMQTPVPLTFELVGALMVGVYLGRKPALWSLTLVFGLDLVRCLLGGTCHPVTLSFRLGLIAAGVIASGISRAKFLPVLLKSAAVVLILAPYGLWYLVDPGDNFIPIYFVAIAILLLLTLWRMPEVRDSIWLLLWGCIGYCYIGTAGWLFVPEEQNLTLIFRYGLVFPSLLSVLQVAIVAKLRYFVPESSARLWLDGVI